MAAVLPGFMTLPLGEYPALIALERRYPALAEQHGHGVLLLPGGRQHEEASLAIVCPLPRFHDWLKDRTWWSRGESNP